MPALAEKGFSGIVGRLVETTRSLYTGYSSRDIRNARDVLSGNITPELREEFKQRQLDQVFFSHSIPSFLNGQGINPVAILNSPAAIEATKNTSQKLESLSLPELDRLIQAEARRNVDKWLPPSINLPAEIKALPEICQDGVVNMLARLKILKEKKYQPRFRSVEEVLSIENHFPPLVRELFSTLKHFKGGSSFADTLNDLAINNAWDLAEELGRKNAWDAVNSASGNIVYNAPSHFYQAVSWETVKDQPGFEKNPFSFLLSLNELGAVVSFLDDSGLEASVPFRKGEGKRWSHHSFIFDPDGSLRWSTKPL